MSFREFCAFIDAYEQSGIEADARPPAALSQALRDAGAIFASDALRVTETLARLGIAAQARESAFREAPPHAPALPLRLPASAWLVLARVRGAIDPALAASRDDLRGRAEICCTRLTAAATGSAALVGHGWFNRAVARALTAKGWRKSDGPGLGRPWGYAVYVPPASQQQ